MSEVERGSWAGVRVLTIGHSTRSLEELVALLRAHDVALLVDIRSVPRSRRFPHFDTVRLSRALPQLGLGYAHVPRLGGLRTPVPDSRNRGLEQESFRGYADYMLTEEFARGLAELRDLSEAGQVAIMCAEVVPWRCHRSLTADALVARGASVGHILGPDKVMGHRVTRFACVDGESVTYPPVQRSLLD